ncbi:MAG: hypothetical protein L6R40_003347 [Gallowayella cf. fulva]|nr:MAG: hypothetical protein L6R40_003347 [Xanthomendoza cf. fulva]
MSRSLAPSPDLSTHGLIEAMPTEGKDPAMSAGDATTMGLPERPSGFPLMRLPRELREWSTRITSYNMSNTYSLAGAAMLTLTPRDANREDPPQTYNEAMPIYFSKARFFFPYLEKLGMFFESIGPFPRQHITNISFEWRKSHKRNTFANHQTFRLLSECAKLIELRLVIYPYLYSSVSIIPSLGLKTALQIRGIKMLNLISIPADSNENLSAVHRAGILRITESLQVLQEPYTDAEIKRREARGIIMKSKKRLCFDGTGKESRAERYARRKMLKELS